MRSFAAPQAFICGPLKKGLIRLGFGGLTLGGAANAPLICSPYAPFCGTKGFFFCLGGLKWTLKTGPKWAVWGAPNEPSSIYIYIYGYIYICCKKLVQDLPFYKLKTGPSFLFFFFLFFIFYFQKSHSPCRKKRIFEKQAKNNQKNTFL